MVAGSGQVKAEAASPGLSPQAGRLQIQSGIAVAAGFSLLGCCHWLHRHHRQVPLRDQEVQESAGGPGTGCKHLSWELHQCRRWYLEVSRTQAELSEANYQRAGPCGGSFFWGDSLATRKKCQLLKKIYFYYLCVFAPRLVDVHRKPALSEEEWMGGGQEWEEQSWGGLEREEGGQTAIQM